MGTWYYKLYIIVIMSKDNHRSAFMLPDAHRSFEDLADRRAKRNYNNYICKMHTLCGFLHHHLSFHLIFRPLYQTPGTIANFFALYFPPSSFLYLRSFFLAQSAIWPTAIAMNSAVLQCLFTSKIAIQAMLSKV